MGKITDNFYLEMKEPNRSCLLSLRTLILKQDTNIVEKQKWGMPCFCFKKKMFCYLWTDKKTGNPYLLFVEGKHLNHPKLEAGNRARMKIFNVDPNKDLPFAAITALLNQALDLYRTGVIPS